MSKVAIVAEIGINYADERGPDAFLENAKRLIRIAATAGCDYVKFQKRVPHSSIPSHKHSEEKVVPWREEPTTYLQYKKDLEFSHEEFRELSNFALGEGCPLFASVWDTPSAKFMRDLTGMVKIPSAKITDYDLLKRCSQWFDTRIMSTGMSTEAEITQAIHVLNPTVIMHTNAVYPTPVDQLKLGQIRWLWEEHTFAGVPQIGYSNHYYGTKALYVALGMGVKWVEFHVTQDHTAWGSDHAASIEPHGVFEIVKAIRDFEGTLWDGFGPRQVYPGEEYKKHYLRG